MSSTIKEIKRVRASIDPRLKSCLKQIYKSCRYINNYVKAQKTKNKFASKRENLKYNYRGDRQSNKYIKSLRKAEEDYARWKRSAEKNELKVKEYVNSSYSKLNNLLSSKKNLYDLIRYY